MGQRALFLTTRDGNKNSARNMTFQVAQVSKALGSVSQMVDHGNKVVFETDWYGTDSSYIQNRKSGEKIWLKR